MPNTGLANLPDIGQCTYNTVTFSALYKSSINGVAVPDLATRTIKWMEYTITVDGVVTLPAGAQTTDAAWVQLRNLLDQPAGILNYSNKGFGPLIVNQPGLPLRDMNWGPMPKTLEFQPLGGSRGAFIKWQVVVCIPEIPAGAQLGTSGNPASSPNMVQFNSDIAINYDEEGYASISMRGTLQIAMTRKSVNDRSIQQTADVYRYYFINQALKTIDLLRFRIERRHFQFDRAKSTMEWEILATEFSPMQLPPGATNARGTMSVRPFSPGKGATVKWLCSLRCTYTIRKDWTRITAWWAFVTMLYFRVSSSKFGFTDDAGGKRVVDLVPPAPAPPSNMEIGIAASTFFGLAELAGRAFGSYLASQKALEAARKPVTPSGPRGIIVHFGFDEGLYLDSKTITFEASWMLVTSLTHLLLATGVWRNAGIEGDRAGNPLWVASMSDIMSARSWTFNNLNPTQDAIVDFGW
jgi:hypothetical protein